MKVFTKVTLSIVLLIAGIYLGNSIFLSKTEQMISWLYVIVLILTIWKWRFYKLHYVFALVFIVLSVVLYMIGITMIRYVHYVDKSATWTYYFFATGTIFSLIDMFKNRKEKK